MEQSYGNIIQNVENGCILIKKLIINGKLLHNTDISIFFLIMTKSIL